MSRTFDAVYHGLRGKVVSTDNALLLDAVDCTVLGMNCVVYGRHCRISGLEVEVHGDEMRVSGMSCWGEGNRCRLSGMSIRWKGEHCTATGMSVRLDARPVGPYRIPPELDSLPAKNPSIAECGLQDNFSNKSFVSIDGLTLVGGSQVHGYDAAFTAIDNVSNVVSNAVGLVSRARGIVRRSSKTRSTSSAAVRQPEAVPKLPPPWPEEPECAGEGELECSICFVRAVCTVLEPCYHAKMCMKCAHQIAGPADATCPFCKKLIERVRRTF